MCCMVRDSFIEDDMFICGRDLNIGRVLEVVQGCCRQVRNPKDQLIDREAKLSVDL